MINGNGYDNYHHHQSKRCVFPILLAFFFSPCPKCKMRSEGTTKGPGINYWGGGGGCEEGEGK